MSTSAARRDEAPQQPGRNAVVKPMASVLAPTLREAPFREVAWRHADESAGDGPHEVARAQLIAARALPCAKATRLPWREGAASGLAADAHACCQGLRAPAVITAVVASARCRLLHGPPSPPAVILEKTEYRWDNLFFAAE